MNEYQQAVIDREKEIRKSAYGRNWEIELVAHSLFVDGAVSFMTPAQRKKFYMLKTEFKMEKVEQ